MAEEDREIPGRNALAVSPWRERAFAAVVSLGTFAAALFHARPTSDATHDEAIVRVLGFGFVGAWRALDALVTLPFALLPGSMSIHRAEIASALGAAIAAAVLYRLTRSLLERCAKADWLGPFVAAIATWATVLGTAWQAEAASPGGATWGALLPFIIALIFVEKYVQNARFALGALACGLAISYEPLVGAASVAGAVTFLAMTRTRPNRADVVQAVPAILIGAGGPIAFALSRRSVSPLSLPFASPFVGWLGTTQPTTRGDLAAFAHTELGWVALFAAGVGLVLAAMVPKARALAAAVLATMLPLALAVFLGAPAGPDRYAAASLALVAAANVLAAVGMQAAVRAVARANVPFAQASAAMIVVLELTFAAVSFDESSLAAIDRKNRLGAHWDADALDAVPDHAILFVADPRIMLHLAAARAAGTLRADLTMLSLSDIAGPAMLDALAKDPNLAPIVRDVALTGSASELSLATLASSRPVLVQYDSKWDKSLTRHLVPAGFFDVFMPEPHGVTDRKRALDAFLPLREKIEKEVSVPRDPEMTAVSASLMRARLDALVAIDERDLLPRAIDDVRAFAPDDPVANRLVLKLVAARAVSSTK